MESNSLCSVCGGLQASAFCVCTSSLPFLCVHCAQKHVLQPDFHYLLSLPSSSLVSPSNQLQCKVWLMCLRHSQDRLRDNLQHIERCREAIETAFDTATACLMRKKGEFMEELDRRKGEMKGEIEEAVRETEENAVNYYYKPGSELAAAVWKHSQENSSGDIAVFTYNVEIVEEMIAKSVKLEFNFPKKQLETVEIKQEIKHFCDIGVQTYKERYEIPPVKRVIATSDPLIHYKSDIKHRICCNSCGKSRNPGSFSIISMLKAHKMCKICDNCFNKDQKLSNCLVCGKTYDFDDQSSSKFPHKKPLNMCKRCLLPISSEENSENLCLSCSTSVRKCKCGARIDENGLRCRNSCLCAPCLLSGFISTRSNQCPVCTSEVSCQLSEGLQCAYCCRGLKLRTESIYEGVSGLCECGALLCCFCIRVQGEECYCPVSGDVFRPIADVGEVEKAQRGNKAACYCAGLGEALAKLKCGHMVHNDCRSKTFRCRVCRAAVRELPKAKVLKDYLPTSG